MSHGEYIIENNIIIYCLNGKQYNISQEEDLKDLLNEGQNEGQNQAIMEFIQNCTENINILLKNIDVIIEKKEKVHNCDSCVHCEHDYCTRNAAITRGDATCGEFKRGDR